MIKRVIIFVLQLMKRPLLYLRHNKIHLTSRVCKNVLMTNTTLGRYSYIGNNCILNNAEIGNYCSIAPAVQIGGMEHSYWDITTSTHVSDECYSNLKTIIEDDVWIAAGSIVKQGVYIGRGAVVGANSFVNKNVPPYAIVVGSPAKIVKYRFGIELQECISESHWWMYEPNKARTIIETIKKKI